MLSAVDSERSDLIVHPFGSKSASLKEFMKELLVKAEASTFGKLNHLPRSKRLCRNASWITLRRGFEDFAEYPSSSTLFAAPSSPENMIGRESGAHSWWLEDKRWNMYLEPIAEEITAISEELRFLRAFCNPDELLLDYIPGVLISRGPSQSIV